MLSWGNFQRTAYVSAKQVKMIQSKIAYELIVSSITKGGKYDNITNKRGDAKPREITLRHSSDYERSWNTIFPFNRYYHIQLLQVC